MYEDADISVPAGTNMYEDADIEKEYSIEKAVQRLRKKRMQKEIFAYKATKYHTENDKINADSLAVSLKSGCQIVEHGNMTVYAPVIAFR